VPVDEANYYNIDHTFIINLQAKEVWKEAFLDLQRSTTKSSHSMLLTTELKHLYTAITRAKANLWIYESKLFDEHSLPILRIWREGTNNVPLIDIIDPNNPSSKFQKSLATAKVSTPKQWKSQGDFLLKNNRWKQAAMCYRKAHRFDLEAEALLANPHLSRQQYHEIVIAYLQADEVAHSSVHLLKIAENLYRAAKCPDDFLDIAWLYKSLKKVTSYHFNYYVYINTMTFFPLGIRCY
jgi:tetratricopeptide (TPR) repeat protein